MSAGDRFAVAVIAIPAAFGAGTLGAWALLRNSPRTIAADLIQPLPVVTAWGAFGERCFAVLALTVVAATFALLAALRFAPDATARDAHAPDGDPPEGTANEVGSNGANSADRRARRLVIFAAAGSLLCTAVWPFDFSSDVYAYAAYGEMAARGIDPYVRVAAAVRGPAIDPARWQWGGTYPACVYGPAFVAFARAIWSLTSGFGIQTALATLRASAALAFLGSIAIFDAALAGLAPRRRLRLVCAYGLHPVVLWSVAEGHNDAFVLLGAATATLLARRGSAFAAGGLLGLSGAWKATGAALAAGFALEAALVRRMPRAAFGALGGIAAAAAVSVPPLLPGLAALGTHGRYAPAISLQALLGPVPAIMLAVAAAGAGTIILARRNRAGYAWFGLAFVAALPNLYPWYALWLVPWALAAGATRASYALYGVTILALVRYLPDAAGNMTNAGARAAALVALLPLVLAVPGALDVLVKSSKKAVAPS